MLEINRGHHLPSGHVYIFQVPIVLSSFDDEDCDIWILSKTASDYTTRGSSSVNSELLPTNGIPGPGRYTHPQMM
jgi:hypothetical protein